MRPLFLAPLLGLAVSAADDSEPSELPNLWPLPDDFDRYAPLNRGIEWHDCSPELVGECGRFEVPMDYKNPAAGKASLAVSRLRAEKEPKKGTLFTNPGGPGREGTWSLLVLTGEQMMKASGGHYDVVSWDPRGVGNTFPRANCFDSKSDEHKLLGGSMVLDRIEMPSNLPLSKDALASFYGQAPEVDKRLEKLGKQCMDYSPDVLEYLGTAATVRDMVALHDYLEGQDKPLNYWGLSYGTIIGTYFSNMFPERVERLILDAVVHPRRWTSEAPHESWQYSIASAHVSLNGFVSECVKAGPQRCSFTNKNDSEAKMHERITGLINRAFQYKKANSTSPVGSGELRRQLLRDMGNPRSWSTLAKNLAYYDERLPPLKDVTLALGPASSYSNSDVKTQEHVEYAQQAIECGDARDVSPSDTTEEVFKSIEKATTGVSPIFGPVWNAAFYCHKWPVRAVERYAGPWNKKPANKVLIIGNEGDPSTPYRDARTVASWYRSANAALVKQEGYGHTSFAMESDCTSSIIRNYLVNGLLPKSPETICEHDEILFPEPEEENSLRGKNTQGYQVVENLNMETAKQVLMS
ncbi:Abhydrolase domain-containing protein [Ceratobasidium sp. AG-Ba]|nr:Abhydrolase domain-containing protein [Ceratobasidium sp. AG-Ba]